MKISGVVVLYNPKDNVIDNVNSYVSLLDELFVCDNSTKKNLALLRKIKSLKNVSYIDMNGNQGIAMALKTGVNASITKGYDFCLTMDDDSSFPTEEFAQVKEYLMTDDIENYGVLSLNTQFEMRNQLYCSKGIIDVNTWITSGNFINLRNYKKIDGFNEKLFIDYVDHNLCEQFISAGYKIGVISECAINHTLGCPSKHKILWKTVLLSNHAPIRLYYRYRNLIYLYLGNNKFYKNLLVGETKNIFKIIICEKNKTLKIKMIFLGILDGLKGKLGKYSNN